MTQEEFNGKLGEANDLIFNSPIPGFPGLMEVTLIGDHIEIRNKLGRIDFDLKVECSEFGHGINIRVKYVEHTFLGNLGDERSPFALPESKDLFEQIVSLFKD